MPVKREPLSFQVADSKRTLYEGSEDEMLMVYEVMISDLKTLVAKYGKQAPKMKATYNKRPKGELKLIQVHKMHTI